MDLHTYGKSSAAIALAKVVRKFGHVSHKVATLVEDCNLMMRELQDVENTRVYFMLWHACRKEMLSRVDKCALPKDVKSHLRLNLVAIMRDAIRKDKLEK